MNLCLDFFPLFCLHWHNFRGMLHLICDVPVTKTCNSCFRHMTQSELVNVGAQIDSLTIRAQQQQPHI